MDIGAEIAGVDGGAEPGGCSGHQEESGPGESSADRFKNFE